MDYIVIAGQKVRLSPLPQKEVKGLWLGLIAAFELLCFEFNGTKMALLVSKGNNTYSPVQRRKISQKLEAALDMPCAFYFNDLPTYERDRLVGQGVYFIVSSTFAFIPSLLANRKTGKRTFGERLLPSTQYVLFYHLQFRSLDGLSLQDLIEVMPYKYSTLSRSMQQLEALGLARFEAMQSRTKRLLFSADNLNLWQKAQPMLIAPVQKVLYSCECLTEGIVGGISALSHYSMLAPEEISTRVLASEQLKALESSELDLTTYEDIQRIEVWKYPPIPTTPGYVDRLSLYLSLKNDHDPRVEKELETMIENMPW